jgi:hypothetical protein
LFWRFALYSILNIFQCIGNSLISFSHYPCSSRTSGRLWRCV